MEETNTALDNLDIAGMDWRIEIIPVDQMYMGRYQRPLDERWIEKRQDDFKPWLLGTVTVSERHKAKKRFATVDGQHRRELAARNNLSHLAAVVFYDLTEPQEAALFSAFQQERRNVTPFQRYTSDLIALKPRAKAIDKIMKEEGWEFVASGSGPYTVRAVTLIERIYDEDPSLLRTLLRVAGLTWGELPGANNQQTLGGLYAFLKDVPDFDEDRFIDRLQSVTPFTLLDRATKLREGRGKIGPLTRYVREAIETEYRRRKAK
jgi:hypothetical protein